jgi:putative FmdB family regulatory protein
MPIYEYECQACGHVFDALQKMSDGPLTDCPDCSEPQLRKLLSAPNFRLKGGGWYETDFKDRNKRNLAGDAGTSEIKSDGKSGDDAKKDARGADKAEKKTAGGKSADARSSGDGA